MSAGTDVPIAHTDPINAKILAISEDRIQGFVRDPIGAFAEQSGVEAETVIDRVRAMLRAGTIRRVRQTLMATNLAEGALVAWQYPAGKLNEAFRFHILTHCYWREGGPEFRNVNIMAVAHGTEKEAFLAHKAAIDEHLVSIGIPVSYTNVFWGRTQRDQTVRDLAVCVRRVLPVAGS